MNRGLVGKALREMLPVTVFLGGLLFLVSAVLAFVLPGFREQFSDQILRLPFVQNIVRAMVGMEPAVEAGPAMFQAIPWVHPVVLALLWAHAIVTCTRVPAGEVDRGTIDVLGGLPVSRWEIHLSETVAWLGAAVVLVLLVFLGNALGGAALEPGARPLLARRIVVASNLLGLYLAAGALAWLASSLADRRGRAITTTFLILLVSFLINYLRPFWVPADRLSFLSLLEYHQPLFVLRDGGVPVADLVVLVAAAAAMWLIAGIVFARRDLRAM